MPFSKLSEVRAQLEKLSNENDVAQLLRFFKTGKGEYGEGDLFRGVRTPSLRALAKNCRELSLRDVAKLLEARFHEDRALALIILCERFEKGSPDERERIYSLYLEHAHFGHINNWDLVDISAPQIVGGYLLDKDRSILRRLVLSPLLWERRVAIVSTLAFIRAGQFDDVFALAEKLLSDKEDLLHKATGWMLREAGKRDAKAELAFLERFRRSMPRTMLRYAIEKFPELLRRKLMS